MEGGYAAAQNSVLSSGRQLLKPVELFSGDDVFRNAASFCKFNNTPPRITVEQHIKCFMALWRSLRGECWVVNAICHGIDQSEAEGMAQERFATPFHTCLNRYLFRNCLFRRLRLPQRYIGAIKVCLSSHLIFVYSDYHRWTCLGSKTSVPPTAPPALWRYLQLYV